MIDVLLLLIWLFTNENKKFNRQNLINKLNQGKIKIFLRKIRKWTDTDLQKESAPLTPRLSWTSKISKKPFSNQFLWLTFDSKVYRLLKCLLLKHKQLSIRKKENNRLSNSLGLLKPNQHKSWELTIFLVATRLYKESLILGFSNNLIPKIANEDSFLKSKTTMTDWPNSSKNRFRNVISGKSRLSRTKHRKNWNKTIWQMNSIVKSVRRKMHC